MAKVFSVFNLIAVILVLILSFLLYDRNAPSGPFDFYIISFRWPQSYCNPPGVKCETPIKDYFTIHGIWPQYNPNTQVPPFNKSGCTTTTPTPVAGITQQLLAPILGDMTNYWPNLQKYSIIQPNLVFWQSEWKKHGMCFTNPDQPLQYFQVALNYIQQHNLLDILKNSDPPIVPDDTETYDRDRIRTVIGSSSVGVLPEIHCNKETPTATEQLMEIRICFDNKNAPINCPTPFSPGCGTTQSIRFPKA
ncbi:putative Ribonuclease 2 [Tripterygium wilfordii]|uniref:Putative Ribonuclease 2 n=1 Tax=Tripterygium wilfordii TaxID=458696 RepID=A0A7J7C8I8_TRIWF|nr:ribonuclease 1-like [Tripterygium wilfordii]KAF5730066.1 putative Ribonuclease 2 [Tripterygium wilfordii]